MGTWNIGTLEAKSLELSDELSKYNIYVACVQETRWKGYDSTAVKRYKLWYVELDGRRSGVGILVSNKLLEQVVNVNRCNDRTMLVRIVLGGEITSIISAYRPQVGLDELEKLYFWDCTNNIIGNILRDEKVFVGGDFNGHMGKEADSYESVHGGFGLGVRNESGEQLLHFSLAHDLVIANSIFKKKEEHLITYKSVVHTTQIDYALVRRTDKVSSRDYKLVFGTKMPTQHRLFVLVFHIEQNSCRQEGKVSTKDYAG